jgi:hypothetical protein
MFEYKFVTIELVGIFNRGPKDDYRKVIEEHAKQGWRLVQIFAPGTAAEGRAKYFEIIFERPKQNG